jgi:DNA-3-methyladenine glycosylase
MCPRATTAASSDALPAGAVVPAAFFGRAANEVAADLIGKILWRLGYGGGRLAEVEAYLPQGDPASHSARGRTQRNAAMFGPPGRIYVFLSYGVHYLLNIVCERESVGSAVLIRSLEPVGTARHPHEDVGACGPGRVGQALGILQDMSGLALGEESGVFVLDDGLRPEVGRSTRIGISRGGQLPLRHYMVGSRYISGPARLNGGPGR